MSSSSSTIKTLMLRTVTSWLRIVGRGPTVPGTRPFIGSVGRPDEARLVGEDHRLGAVPSARFHVHALDVGPNRLDREPEELGDLAVGQAPGDQGEDLRLPGRQLLGY